MWGVCEDWGWGLKGEKGEREMARADWYRFVANVTNTYQSGLLGIEQSTDSWRCIGRCNSQR